jgi:hypothetical protein
MQGAQTSAAPGEQVASVNDSRLHAINAERLTLFLLSRRQADQCYAVIALALIARRNKEHKAFAPSY